MKEKERNRIVRLLITFGCVLIITCSCSVSEFSGKKPSNNTPELTASLTSSPSTAASLTSSPSTEASSAATATPNPTPTPVPTPVYIPREKLPDGRLFEDGLYAVLPGEGAYYNVFDCYGKQIYSFIFTDGESNKPIGLFTEESLAPYVRLTRDDVQLAVPENTDDYDCLLKSNENGFYQIDRAENANTVYLYNTKGKLIRTLSYQTPQGYYGYVDTVVACYSSETIISFQCSKWLDDSSSLYFDNAIYFVSKDGTINNTCRVKDLPARPAGILARKYIITYTEGFNDENCSIYDFSGHLMQENVTLVRDNNFTLWSSEANTYISICDTYMKNGQAYDSSFNPVAVNTVDSDGNLIYGAQYDVGGILCTALYREEGGTDYYPLINTAHNLAAAGSDGSKIAVKTSGSEYVFDSFGLSFYGMNQYMLVLGPGADGSFQVISLKTGNSIYTIKKAVQVQIAEEYILVSNDSGNNYNGSYADSYVIDKDGNIRFASKNAYAQCSIGEYIILRRGPYTGIADLNGDWIMKSLNWELTRDQEYIYPWE